MYGGRKLWLALACVTYFAIVESVPPDKIYPLHIIKTRSIDLNNAHALAMESRLEKIVKPTEYKLDLEPYLDDGIYKGRVSINITWLRESDEFTLHSDYGLNITDTVLMIQKNKDRTLSNVLIKRTYFDPKKSTYTITLEKSIKNNTKGRLDLSFEGKMELEATEAFFKTSYIDEMEQESFVAATQLRPTNARKMFPCFDEPEYKATFLMSVVRPRNMVALGNTHIEKIEDISGEPDAVRVHYKETPPLSTFSLGLVIADLKQLGNSTFHKDKKRLDLELRVWGREEFLPALEGLHEKLDLVVSELYKWWKVPTPLQKLDIVALPNYQGIKPADSWGLIVFKESDLTSRGYMLLLQEISYQWLGLLTTPAWWNFSHLNKALVNYAAIDTVLKINNGLEMEGKWPMTVLYSLYYEFGKRFPHSRITGMKQETACTQIELLLRMLNYTVGSERLKLAIRTVIDTNKYKTFKDDDFWNVIEKINGDHFNSNQMKDIANSWLDKSRVPIITATRANKSIKFEQKVFIRERTREINSPNNGLFWIYPIVIVRQKNLDFNNTLTSYWYGKGTVCMPEETSMDQFFIVNPEEIAPYIVNYDTNNWYLLSVYLQSENREKIPELTRAKLLHDAWNLASAGELSFAVAFNMTLFLRHERHPLVWDPVFTMIDHIGRHVDNSDVHDKFQAYIRILLSPLYKEISNEEEAEEPWRKNLRSLTKTFLCKLGYKPCVNEAQEEYRKWMEASNPDEGNPIANQYICPVFKWGTKEEWEFGLQRVINFPSSRKQSERTYLLKTLAGCPNDGEKILRLLNLTVLNGNGNFTDTDVFLIFSMLNSNSKGYTLFYFLRDNWDALKEKFHTKTNLWDSLITSATSQFTTQEGLKLCRDLAKEHAGQFGSAEHIIENSLKIIKEEAKWSDDNLPVLKDWLNKFHANTFINDDDFIGKTS